MNELQDWVLTLSSSPWVYVAVLLFCLVDGFFPPVPSETAVIALAATSVSVGQPNLALLWLVATAGAFCGDQVAYTIGKHADVRSWRLFRHPRGKAALDRASSAIHGRGVSFILTARFIPVGRVAVNTTAGAVHYPRRRFVPIVLAAAAMWAGYGIAIGVLAGRWFNDQPLLALVVGVTVGLLVGLVVDPLVARRAERRAERHAESDRDTE